MSAEFDWRDVCELAGLALLYREVEARIVVRTGGSDDARVKGELRAFLRTLASEAGVDVHAPLATLTDEHADVQLRLARKALARVHIVPTDGDETLLDRVRVFDPIPPPTGEN